MPLVTSQAAQPAPKPNGRLNGHANGKPCNFPAGENKPARFGGAPARHAAAAEPKRRQRTFAGQQKAAERAAEAASAAQQSQRVVTRIANNIRTANEAADTSRTKTEALQSLLGAVNTPLAGSIAAISRAARRARWSSPQILMHSGAAPSRSTLATFDDACSAATHAAG